MAKPALLQRLARQFGDDPATLPGVEQHIAVYERPNLHLAADGDPALLSPSRNQFWRPWHTSEAGTNLRSSFRSRPTDLALLPPKSWGIGPPFSPRTTYGNYFADLLELLQGE